MLSFNTIFPFRVGMLFQARSNMISSISYATCEMRIFTNSLVLAETEPIIPEWLFKTTTVIEPERIEFEMGNILEL